MSSKELSFLQLAQAVRERVGTTFANLDVEITSINAEVDAIIIDLPEVTIGADLDYQRARIEKVSVRLKIIKEQVHEINTQIHGGGTGKEQK